MPLGTNDWEVETKSASDLSLFKYCMRAIITRGLYTFYSLFEVKKRFFQGAFS